MLIQLNTTDKRFLLTVARASITDYFEQEKKVDQLLQNCEPRLLEKGASFVTLTKQGKLRGCIGTLEAYQSLVQDVCEHAAAAAFQDYRFSPVKKQEISSIEIEISYLTPSVELVYQDSDDLLRQLNSEEDGVILSDGYHRATFLPQVWEQLPEKKEFLAHLCVKMGLSSSAWQEKHLHVEIYHVVHFSENE